MTPEQEASLEAIAAIVLERRGRAQLRADLAEQIAELLPGLTDVFIQRAIDLSDKSQGKGGENLDHVREALSRAVAEFAAVPETEGQE